MVRLLNTETLCLGGDPGATIEISPFANMRRSVLIEIREPGAEGRYLDFDATPAEACRLAKLLIEAATAALKAEAAAA